MVDEVTPYEAQKLVPGEQVTERQAAIVDLVVSEGLGIPEVAERWGCDKANLYRDFRKDHVQDYMQRMVAKAIGMDGARSLSTMRRLAINAKSEHTRFLAAKDLLDRAGHAPVEKKAIAIKGDVKVRIDLT